MFDIFTIAPEVLLWVDDAIVILTLISGIAGKLFHSRHKAVKELTRTTEELVKVINITPIKNEAFLEIAETEALKGATLLLSKLIK